MENRFQTTFIPRRPVVSTPGVRPKGPPSFLMIIGGIIIVLALAASGGTYFYRGYLTKSNAEKKQQIEEEIKNFEPELTRELTILKARMDIGKQLLDKHNAFTQLLKLLELNTAQTVRFKEFSFLTLPDKKITLAMKGESQSYAAIAFQSDVFSKITQLKNPIFSDLNLNDEGKIDFTVKAELDSAAVSYKRLVEGLAPKPAPLPPPSQGTGTATGTATSTQTGTTTQQGS